MLNRYSRFIPAISLAGDLIILNLFFVLGFCVFIQIGNCFEPSLLVFYLYLNITWLILAFVFDEHKFERHTKKIWLLYTNIKIIVFFFFLFILYFQVHSLQYYPRNDIKVLFPIFFIVLLLWKFSLYYAFYLYRKFGFNYRNVIIIGHTRPSVELSNFFINNKWHGYRFLGFFDEDFKGKYLIGKYKDIVSFLEVNHVDEVYISWHGMVPEIMTEISDIIAEFPVKVRILPDLGNFSYKTAELVGYGSLPVIQIHQGPLVFWYNKLIKRVFDILISLIIIVGVLWWLVIMLYLISLFDERQGVFFRQKRTRIDGDIFWCLKFRSMYKNDVSDILQAVENDARVSWIGKFLRKSSLDELPQFINVLIGQMSVVGPRPHMLKHTEDYRKLIKSYMLRHTVKPGITGLAQVNGYRGEIKVYDDLKRRVEFDVNYIENWTLKLDLRIIIQTLWLIFKGQKRAY